MNSALKDILIQSSESIMHKSHRKLFDGEKDKVKNISHAVCNEISLIGVIISNYKFEKCRFVLSEFHDIFFNNCNFIDCDFIQSRIDFGTFSKCTLEKIRFEKVELSNTDFINCQITKNQFEEKSNLNRINWISCFIESISFRGTEVVDSIIDHNHNKKERDFQEIRLFSFNSVFYDCQIKNFQEMKLKFSNTKFQSCSFYNTILNSTTFEFDPEDEEKGCNTIDSKYSYIDFKSILKSEKNIDKTWKLIFGINSPVISTINRLRN